MMGSPTSAGTKITWSLISHEVGLHDTLLSRLSTPKQRVKEAKKAVDEMRRHVQSGGSDHRDLKRKLAVAEKHLEETKKILAEKKRRCNELKSKLKSWMLQYHVTEKPIIVTKREDVSAVERFNNWCKKDVRAVWGASPRHTQVKALERLAGALDVKVGKKDELPMSSGGKERNASSATVDVAGEKGETWVDEYAALSKKKCQKEKRKRQRLLLGKTQVDDNAALLKRKCRKEERKRRRLLLAGEKEKTLPNSANIDPNGAKVDEAAILSKKKRRKEKKKKRQMQLLAEK